MDQDSIETASYYQIPREKTSEIKFTCKFKSKNIQVQKHWTSKSNFLALES